ncbi:MAG TPA: serine/threonine-protein kinase [Polyangiaceae bacterium]|jgi:serine/threonine-protein kinase
MPSDSSNAREAPGDQTDPTKGSDGGSVSGDLQSGKTPSQARILSDSPPPSIDPEDEGRALLGELTVGSVVDGKYRVDQVLGRGAMGVVVAATHQQLGERVALKFLRYRAKPGGTDDFQSRFRREARVSAKLKNEHITRVIDVGVWRERVPYMVMDYLNGQDLREVLKATGGPLPIPVALDYVVQICTGIAEAHANGIVHRDLKPSNLFITKRPDGSDLLRILDFGISKWSAGESEVDELTQTGVVLGSPKYMSPEQLFGSADVDARADVWSIGAILYEMLSGRPPFDLPTFTKICAELSTNRMPPSLHERRPEITPELDAVVMKCFVRAPEERIQNVAELAGALLDAIGAPFADAVRLKIASTLDPRSGRDAMAASGGSALSLSSGSYRAVLLSNTGSSSIVRPPSSAPVDTLVSSAGSKAATLPAPPDVPDFHPARRRLAVGLLVAVVLAGGVAYFAFGGRDETKATAPAATTAGQPLPPAQLPATATTTATAASPTATDPAAASAAAAASASAATAATSTPRVWNRGWRPPPVHTTAPPPPPTTAAQPPPPPTQPVATAPPTPTQKVDPLGERQ